MIRNFKYGKDVWFMHNNKACLSHIYIKPIYNKEGILTYEVPYFYLNRKGISVNITLKLSIFDLFESKEDLLKSL